MASHSVTLAKLSRPKLFGVLERERLFAALDAARRHPAVWIAGPPGAGKTTLVTSYLQARKLPCLWYQVDSGDADPASFFYYLAQAVPSTRGARREPLRLLTPDYLADLPGFARRFFRTLFERLPARAALVLDNFQQAGDSAAFHALVAIALAEARDGINLIVLSRTDPPASFARELANGLIGTIGWDELRLTDDETRAIATARREVDAATLALLQQQSAGWAAGLMLILQGLEHTGAVRPALPAETLEAVFGYFAGHVLDQVPAATRELLMRTAFLPRVNAAAAQALTGNADAASLLDQLYRQRLFTDRHAGGAVSYQYHALFREFLQSRVDAAYTAEQRRALRQRSAELLESDGESADALRLHVANADWEAATALILKRARALIAEGRWLTLEAWVALLPKEQVARTPWLMLWLGSSLILVDPARAQAMLQSAFELFVADGDALGQALVATGAVESCNIDAADFSTLDPWIAVLERLLQPGTLVFPSAATRLRVNVAMMLATTLRQPSHPMLSVCLREVLATFDHDIALTAKTDTATQLLQFFDFVGDLQGAVALVERVAPWFERDDLSPFRRAGWLVFFSYHAALVGSYRQGFDALDGLRAIVRDYGMRWFGFFDLLFRSLLTLLGPTPMAATPFLHQIGTSVRSSRPAQFSQYHLARALLYQSQGEASLAIYHGELCLEAGKRCGGALFAILFPTVIASAYVEAGQTERALALVAEARALGSGTPYRSYEALMLMVEAYAHSRRGDASAARDLLARALVRGRDEQTTSLFRWLVAGFRRMLALALRDDIEADCARSLIAQFGVAAESAEVEPWPWPIRIRALGGFSLEIGGVPSQPQRKAQKKPLELLKYVVAQGRHDVSAAHLDAALWPDAEGGAAAEAFEVTLRRLRKLLGNDEAIALKDGKLSLNEGICWVDTWAFERAQAKAEKMLGAGGEPASIEADIDAQGERVLALYPGHFLAGDDEKPWLVGCRQRLASKFLRHVGALGQFWQDRGEPGKAELAYRRAIELDPLAEPMYRRLMSLQAQQGRHPEALETYRSCRHMLSVVLGLQPSAETEAVRRSWLEAG